jgi:hypothetical protein
LTNSSAFAEPALAAPMVMATAVTTARNILFIQSSRFYQFF